MHTFQKLFITYKQLRIYIEAKEAAASNPRYWGGPRWGND